MQQPESIVTTASGRVQGSHSGGVHRFMGVPYAASTAGPRRLRPPAPPERWDGIRPCLEPGPACPQIEAHNERYRVPGPFDEDCLSLNIWTPGIDDAKRPVVLFLHGGGYLAGSGSVPIYDSRHFAERGVVGVTCNYRLAALGFLYLEELFDGYEGSGNLGLLDNIAALEWIQENIAGFGGDPARVTVYGSSAGAISVCALMASARARGLFARGVPVSCAAGVSLSTTTATEIARGAIAHLGVSPGDGDALASVSLDRLVSRAMTLELFKVTERLGLESAPFLPVVDGAVLDRAPMDAIAAGSGRGIDLMIGVTGEESGARHSTAMSAVDAMRLTAVPLPRPKPEDGFDFARIFGEAGPPAEEITSAYRASLQAAGRPHEMEDLFTLAWADMKMLRPTLEFAERHAAHHANTYVFRFMWPSPGWQGALGAFHGVATPYLFDNISDPGWQVVMGANPPQSLADDVHGAIIAFATSGRPGHGAIADWQPFDSRTRTTMLFDTVSGAVDDPDRERRRLFEQVEFVPLR